MHRNVYYDIIKKQVQEIKLNRIKKPKLVGKQAQLDALYNQIFENLYELLMEEEVSFKFVENKRLKMIFKGSFCSSFIKLSNNFY